MGRTGLLAGLAALVVAACAPRAIAPAPELLPTSALPASPTSTAERVTAEDIRKKNLREGLCHYAGGLLRQLQNDEVSGSAFRKGDSALASIDTFCAINPHQLLQQLDVKEGGKIIILYPGAGYHVSPLQIAHSLHNYTAENGQKPFSIEFVYTEQLLNAHQILTDRIAELRSAGFVFLRQEEYATYPKGKEVVLELGIELPSGTVQPFTVTYAIDTAIPEQGDHPYFKQADAEDADIIITHDIDQQNDPALFTHYLNAAAASPRQQLFLFEDYLSMCDGTMAPYAPLPGDISVIARGYGCSHDQKRDYQPHYPCAIVYLPDHEALHVMTVDERREIVWETFGTLFLNRTMTPVEEAIPLDDGSQ